MWQKSFSKTYTGITSKAVWDAWRDVENWPRWQSDISACHLFGAFEPGSYFMLHLKDMAPIKITLTEMSEGESFTDCTAFTGAKMYDSHHVEAVKGGVRITSTLSVKGLLSWVWILLVARNVAKGIPDQTDALVRYLRKRKGPHA